MSKHNNSLSPSSSRRCKCGRYITLGEEHAGIGLFNYECPDCLYRKYRPITAEDYYKGFGIETIKHDQDKNGLQ